MKRILRAWLLCGLLVISCGFISRASESVLSLQFDKVQLKPGETAAGTIQVTEESVTNGMMTITYDTRLELTEAKKTDGRGDDVYVSINSQEKGKLVIAFASKERLAKGALIDLTFKVSDQAKTNDKYPVDFPEAAAYDAEGKELPVGQDGQTLVIVGNDDGKGDDGNKGEDGNKGQDDQKPQSTPGKSDGTNGNGGNAQNKSNGNAKGKKSVSTGDQQKLLLYVVICGIAAVGIAAAVIIKKAESGKRTGKGKRKEDGRRGEK